MVDRRGILISSLLLILLILSKPLASLYTSNNPLPYLNEPVKLGVWIVYIMTTILLLYYLLSLQKTYSFRPPTKKNTGTVAVAITYADQPEDVVLPALKGMSKLRGVDSFYLGDNSRKEENSSRAKRWAKQFGFKYIRIPPRDLSWKCDTLSVLLDHVREDYLFILDKDEVCHEDTVLKLKPYLDSDVVYVQSMKLEKGKSLISRAMAEYNSFFYKVVEPILGTGGKAYFGGSLALLNVSKVRRLGGFSTILEDINLSVRTLFSGYKGYFISEEFSIGHEEGEYCLFLKRHLRYTFGTVSLIRKYVSRVFAPSYPMVMGHLLSPTFLSLGLLGLGFVSAYTGSVYLLLYPVLLFVLLSIATALDPFIGLIAFLLNQSLLVWRIRGILWGLYKERIPWNINRLTPIPELLVLLLPLPFIHGLVMWLFYILYVSPVVFPLLLCRSVYW